MAEVEVTRDGAVQTITLNRPEVYNAFNRALHAGLREAFKEARDPEVRAVVITGAGKGFCAGQDLKEFSEAGNVSDALSSSPTSNPFDQKLVARVIAAPPANHCRTRAGNAAVNWLALPSSNWMVTTTGAVAARAGAPVDPAPATPARIAQAAIRQQRRIS